MISSYLKSIHLRLESLEGFVIAIFYVAKYFLTYQGGLGETNIFAKQKCHLSWKETTKHIKMRFNCAIDSEPQQRYIVI